MRLPFEDGRSPLAIVAFDAETYYDKDYRLSKLTTTLYVRDPRFLLHGAAVWADGDDEPTWIRGADVAAWARSVDWSTTALLCQNTAFDGFLLSHHFGVAPAYYLDTASMSRGEFGPQFRHDLDSIAARLQLGQKTSGALEATKGVRTLTKVQEARLATYARRDVRLTVDAFRALYVDRGYPEGELDVIHLTLQAFCQPKLIIDTALCQAEIDAEVTKKSTLIAQCGVPPSVLMSNPQFAQALRARGVEPPQKVSPRTKHMTYAFAKQDLEFQDLMRDPRVTDLVQARLAVKSTIGQTRAHRLMAHADPALPVLLYYCGAHTHRWTGGDAVNLQNLPSGRQGQSCRLREAIQAPPGFRLVKVDSSHVECRVSAWLAGEESLLELFRRGEDPYLDLASAIFGYPVTKQDHPDERAVGKAAELSLQFGVGAVTFAQNVRAGVNGPPQDISDELARYAVQLYRAKRPRVVAAWRQLDDLLCAMPALADDQHLTWRLFRFENDRVLMPNQLYMHYHQLQGIGLEDGRTTFVYVSKKGPNYLYPAKLFQHLVQSTARTLVAQQAVAIARRYPDIVLLVHDEVVFLVPEAEADDALAFGLACFRTAPPWCADLPLDAEGQHTQHYLK